MNALALDTQKMMAEVDDGIGWLTFNQPERRNAISLEMWQGIGDALEAFEQDDNVRVVVLSGAGGKAFASGADISEFDKHRSNAEQRKQYGEVSGRGNRWLAELSKPMIAMIRGYCVGGGLAVALSADIRFATPDSTFGIPAARLGLGVRDAGLAKLSRLVGPARARDIMFTARFMDAAEAKEMGLINFVTPDDELEAQVRDYAATIAANAPLTVKAAKAAVNAFERYSVTEASKEVAPLVDACFDSEDYKEGRRAFAEKRKPDFKGR
ncbi:MAG: enoyl-CoA hydratase [Gammaproteobacteria bacterium]|nr:enoyl-CoA hydratase [Gammaproteobacteria bacterium]